MPGTCTLCGNKRVTREAAFGGTYVGACDECKEAFDHPGRHVTTCEREECIVCDDYARDPDTKL